MPQVDSSHTDSVAHGINQDGWISGFADPIGADAQPAIWRPDGTRIDLPLLPNFPDAPGGHAFDMNDSGTVVGSSNMDDESFDGVHPVYWTPSHEIVELANPFAPSGYPYGVAKSISANGVIAGRAYNSNGDGHAMRWDVTGTALILSHTTDTGKTIFSSEALRSFDDGAVLGRGWVVINQVGILWTPSGEAIELRPSGSWVIPYGVNNNHHAVGTGDRLGQVVALRWSPSGEPFSLDRLSDAPSNAYDAAFDINEFNFAVGKSDYSNYLRAILWTPDGDAIDLNSLVESSDEWILSEARTITNTGWISGIGQFDPAGPSEAYDRPFSILVPFAGTYGMGDANFDESIDFADLLIVAQHYGSSTAGSLDAGDFNLDGVVDFTDLLAIAQNYGDVFELLPASEDPIFKYDWQTAKSMVPEPNFAGGLIGVGLMLRRRTR